LLFSYLFVNIVNSQGEVPQESYLLSLLTLLSSWYVLLKIYYIFNIL
jgi:hypothetical protein